MQRFCASMAGKRYQEQGLVPSVDHLQLFKRHHIDQSLDFEIFVEAFQNQFATSYGQGQGAKTKAKGKGRGKTPTKTMSNTDDYGKFPFTFLFHRVSGWHQEYEAYKSESRSEAVE